MQQLQTMLNNLWHYVVADSLPSKTFNIGTRDSMLPRVLCPRPEISIAAPLSRGSEISISEPAALRIRRLDVQSFYRGSIVPWF